MNPRSNQSLWWWFAKGFLFGAFLGPLLLCIPFVIVEPVLNGPDPRHPQAGAWPFVLLLASAPLCGVLGGIAFARMEVHDRTRQHRLRMGLCSHCGYELRGLSINQCPECGYWFKEIQSADGDPNA